MIRANRVGVHPSQVDQLGYLVGGGGGTDAYTKTESDAKYVNKDQLKANNKNFYFAYDSATQKYGYKTSKTGDFIPFSSATDKFLLGVSDRSLFVGGSDKVKLLEGGVETNGTGNSKTTILSIKFEVLENISTVLLADNVNFPKVNSNTNLRIPVQNSNGVMVNATGNYVQIPYTNNTVYLSGTYEPGIYYATMIYNSK